MIDGEAAAFWSYAHADNEFDGGQILALAESVVAEFSLVTGRSLSLFVDRDIEWGEQWRNRIDEALSEATFFLPVLTPRFFTRAECRKEFTHFHRQAESRGLGDLMLPILYAPISDFSDDNADELIALASRYQYVDWTSIRLEERSSSAYRKAVNQLSRRLESVQKEVGGRQLSKEVAELESEVPDAGLQDLRVEVDKLLPVLEEAIERNRIQDAQHEAVFALLGPRLHKIEAGGGNPGARFAILQRLAREDLPLGERGLANSQEFARVVLQMDPLLTQVLRYLESYPTDSEVFGDLWIVLEKAREGLDREERRKQSGHQTSAEWYNDRAHLSHLLKRNAEVQAKTDAYIDEGHEIVRRWLDERDRLTQNPQQNEETS